MNRLRATNSVTFANRDIAPTTGTPQYATDGVPGTTSPTIWPAYAFNQMQDELLAVIVAGGLTPDDTNWEQLLLALRLMFRGQNLQAFTSSQTWTVPAGVSLLKVRIVGGGGGGGACSGAAGSGAGGGAGGYAEGIFSVTPGNTIAVTVGAAGSSGGSVSGVLNGGTGGTTSFGAFASATGGQGGVGSSGTSVSAAGGDGGTGSGGSVNLLGGAGGDGQSGTVLFPGNGGASAFGGGGRAATVGFGPLQNGHAPGSGGGAGYNVSTGGGIGAAGIVIVEY